MNIYVSNPFNWYISWFLFFFQNEFVDGLHRFISEIAKFMGPTWGPPGSCRSQMGPVLAPWTLLSGFMSWTYSCEEEMGDGYHSSRWWAVVCTVLSHHLSQNWLAIYENSIQYKCGQDLPVFIQGNVLNIIVCGTDAIWVQAKMK